MKFTYEAPNGTRIEMSIHEDSSLDDVFEEFQAFLRACGYTIEYNKAIDLVNMDE